MFANDKNPHTHTPTRQTPPCSRDLHFGKTGAGDVINLDYDPGKPIMKRAPDRKVYAGRPLEAPYLRSGSRSKQKSREWTVTLKLCDQ